MSGPKCANCDKEPADWQGNIMVDLNRLSQENRIDSVLGVRVAYMHLHKAGLLKEQQGSLLGQGD
jgi:hypothetical protein